MDKRTRRNLLLFFRRFRRSYEQFVRSYSGVNSSFYLEEFIQDNLKVARELFGTEGVRLMRIYVKKLP